MPFVASVRRFACICVALGSLGATTPTVRAQAAEIMPLSEVRAGQTGVGYTVMRGSQPDEFRVEILGILKDSFPGLDLIVGRLNGLGLEKSGVVAGMSGSPVYVDGRLIGAVAYRLVDFGYEAIAGIVPIENMLELRDREQASPPGAGNVSDLLEVASLLLRGEAAESLTGFSPGVRLPGGIGRITTPLGLTGFDPRLTARMRPLFEELGWVPVAGGTSGGALQHRDSLVPGGAIAVQLVRGDMSITATGTITYVDGDRLLAFGHPFMQGGDVDFPLVAAEVITILSSQAASQKLTVVGNEVIGAVRQDRLPGIMGVLGEVPAMIPVSLQLAAGDSSGKHVSFEVVDDPLLTPLYLFFGLVNVVQSFGEVYGEGTIDFRAHMRLGAGQDDIELRGLFASRDQAVVALAGWLSALFGSVQANAFEPVHVEGIEGEVVFLEGVRSAVVQRLWYTRRQVRAGETARLRAVLRPFRGEPFVQEIEVPIPADTPAGGLRITVGSAAGYLSELEAAGAGGAEPTDLRSLVRRLNAAPRSDVLYVVATTEAAGATVAGAPMPALPPSVMEMLNSGASAADVGRLDRRLVYRTGIEMARVISGSGSVDIEIERR